jgi:thiol-disulfide isomerase/thioredoxin
MKTMRWAALFAIAAVFVAAPAMVGAEEGDAAKDAVVKAWEAYKTAQDDYDAKQAPIMEAYYKVQDNEASTDEEKKAAGKKANEAVGELRKESGKALGELRKAFTDEFAKVTDHARYADSPDMLAHGLRGQAAMKTRTNPDEAAKLYDLILKYCPKTDAADDVRSRIIPERFEKNGDFEGALKRSRELLEETGDKYKPALYINIGDYSAALGDAKAASKAYASGLALCEGDLAWNDPRRNTKRYVAIRAKFTGNDAPNVDSKTWLGGEAKSLADMKGSVVIIDFWATWCGPCRAAMPGIDKIYKENKDRGVVAIGLTRFYASGFMPNDSSNLNKGEPVKGITEETYLDHLKLFKERSSLSYPFVVGVEQDFKNYGVQGIPTMAIVNKEGKVAMIVVGSGNDALIETCVKNLLKNGR